MFSRSGKATENMHLPLAKVKKIYSDKVPAEITQIAQRNPIQSSKHLVSYLLNFKNFTVC